MVGPREEARLAHLFAGPGDAAKADPGESLRLVGIHSGSNELLRFHLEVEAELFVEFHIHC